MEALATMLGIANAGQGGEDSDDMPGECAERTQHSQDPRQASRREMQAEIQALRKELDLAQDFLHQNRAQLRNGELARRNAEVSILKTAIAAIMKEENIAVNALHQKLSRTKQVAQRVNGYLEELQNELGISVDNLKRQVPKTLRFHEMSDGSFESITTVTCNTDQSAKTCEFVDYRFAVPSTCAPLVVAVGPLTQHSFLLLGRKPLATVRDEHTWTKRTRPMADQDAVGDMMKRQPTVHSLTLKKGDGSFEVGIYYLTICTGGGKLCNCCVRLYIPTPRSPAMEYDWYGTRRHSENRTAVQSARSVWTDTKTRIEIKDASRKAARGGNRRSEGQKPHCSELLTSTMDLRVRPIRFLYSRVNSEADTKVKDSEKIRQRHESERSQGPEDIWTRLSKPLLSWTRLDKSGRHEELNAKRQRPRSALQQYRGNDDNVRTFANSDVNRRNADTPKDELSIRYNAQGHQRLRPSSAGVRRQDQVLAPSSWDVVGADKVQRVEQGGTTKRPKSARPASAQGSHAPGHDLLERRRPVSAFGRVREWQGFASKESSRVHNERPGSAMSRFPEAISDGVVTTSTGSRRASDAEGNPFGTIVSTGAHEVMEASASAPGGMTAEEQLKVMGRDEARRKIDIFCEKLPESTGARPMSKLKGLIKLHQKDIDAEVLEKKNHGVAYLQRTLLDYEEKDRERTKLPFADVYVKICSGTHLPKIDNQCSPFMTVTLNTSELGQIGVEGRTSIQSSNPNPVWNARFQFDCRGLDKDAALTFTCWHHSSFAHVKDVAVGQCTLEVLNLKLNEHEQWHLPVKPCAETVLHRSLKVSGFHDGGMTSTLNITTFFGKKDAFEAAGGWKRQEAERLPMEQPSPEKQNGIRSSSPRASRQSSSPRVIKLPSSPRVSKLLPDDSRKGGHTHASGHDLTNVEAEHSSALVPHCHENGGKASKDTVLKNDGKGNSDLRLQSVWQSCNKWDWERIGIGADVFDYLSSLQAQERGRMSSQTMDFMLLPPVVGTASGVCPDPERINLEHVATAPDELLLYMTQYSGSHIKRLDIGGCNQLSLNAVLTFTREFRLISRLSLKGHTLVDDSWLSALSGMHLEELNISHCQRITDQGLVAAAAQFPGLRSLDCSRCYQLVEEGMLALSEKCKKLERLFVMGCRGLTRHAISSVLALCPLLVHVEVPGIRVIASDMFALENRCLRNLRGLNVSNCKGFDDRALLNLAGLEALETLNLHANPGITDLGLGAIASFKHLGRLCLARCSKITDNGLIKIATNCRRIRRLELDFCVLISDTGIMFVVDFFESLEYLSVRGCTNVTDVGVRCVLKHCHYLLELDVAHAGADEGEIRTRVNSLHEERRAAQEKEDVEWLYGRRGTPTWTGLEVDANLLPGGQQLNCTFSTPDRGHKVTNALAFDAHRDLPLHLLSKVLLIAQQDQTKDPA